MLYSTYLGGNEAEEHSAIAVDGAGNAYVMGSTGSTDFPTVNALDATLGYDDVFVTKLNPSGTQMLYSTFLGGNDNREYYGGIAVDGAGNAYVTGLTQSSDFPTVNALDDKWEKGSITPKAFVTKIADAAGGGASYTLHASITGSGTITSNPAGINCGAACSASYGAGTSVTLTATPASGFAFTAWSGACSGSGACSVLLDSDKTVGATFTAAGGGGSDFGLSVTITGPGQVTSTPAGIDCGAACSARFGNGATVTLAATPDAGATFTGWGGACSGTGPCGLTMTGDQAVTASFAALPRHLLKVTRPTTGVVTSAPAGINCGGPNKVCNGTFAAVTLTATPNAGYAFRNWVGCPGSAGPVCTLTLTGPATVKANFAKLPKYTLKVAKTKFGAITSAPAGLKCKANAKACSAKFVSGTAVTLTPAPLPGHTFGGWTGACAGNGTCAVLMDGHKGVGASFQ